LERHDRLSIAVSYRQNVGEQYKLLSVNGMPPNEDEQKDRRTATSWAGRPDG
jgi:hypothetical protein